MEKHKSNFQKAEGKKIEDIRKDLEEITEKYPESQKREERYKSTYGLLSSRLLLNILAIDVVETHKAEGCVPVSIFMTHNLVEYSSCIFHL